MKGSFKDISSGEVTSRKIILLGKKFKADEDSFIKRWHRASQNSAKTMQLTFTGIPGTANEPINDLKSKQN